MADIIGLDSIQFISAVPTALEKKGGILYPGLHPALQNRSCLAALLITILRFVHHWFSENNRRIA